MTLRSSLQHHFLGHYSIGGYQPDEVNARLERSTFIIVTTPHDGVTALNRRNLQP
jgi:hypothetical protein